MSPSPLPDGLLTGPVSQGPGGSNYCLEIRTAVTVWSVQSHWPPLGLAFGPNNLPAPYAMLPLGLSFLVNKTERNKKLLWSNAV